MKTIYHIVTSEETITYLTEEERNQFANTISPDDEVLCSSSITDAEHARLTKSEEFTETLGDA